MVKLIYYSNFTKYFNDDRVRPESNDQLKEDDA